ncbi:LysR family transcriptional regulator [Streptomyces sp. AK02-01A]|uniref:LysR family transcriptional regulator n=1 Tax=Streptomyces sp. AK02-01A TaxID=3028648 RepID=UPI0029A94DAD|nr:LysR family transcriptional regulator [Streptomyces sp. AK02-01A]MDX3849645.1 LysR family transcriptional regulator [Streptomyces sp. AK02-01A]MDX3849785.1 LysR family transcriptional regulator [Streptomyces sp. AK02-01A]
MTPAQLRAFAAVVRLGSVKAAAADLSVSEAAVSTHIARLRGELGDKLYARTGAGLAFTPGGLRLAGRAAELLGLQDRTLLEVSQAGSGRRLLRVAASSLFAEHAAPGLIELFASRADDLDVELSVQCPERFSTLLLNRAVDVALGPRPAEVDKAISAAPFLNYQVVGVVGARHPLATRHASTSELRQQTWLLGPSATGRTGIVPTVLRRLNLDEEHQRIFQSHAAALEEAKHGKGVALGLSFAVAEDLARGDLKRLTAPPLPAKGVWSSLALDGPSAPAAVSELIRFLTTPGAIQAMQRSAGVTAGRFRPAIHVTHWS